MTLVPARDATAADWVVARWSATFGPSGYDGHWRPALWWPKDRAWFLGSDRDSPETGFAHRGDDVNPASS